MPCPAAPQGWGRHGCNSPLPAWEQLGTPWGHPLVGVWEMPSGARMYPMREWVPVCRIHPVLSRREETGWSWDSRAAGCWVGFRGKAAERRLLTEPAEPPPPLPLALPPQPGWHRLSFGCCEYHAGGPGSEPALSPSPSSGCVRGCSASGSSSTWLTSPPWQLFGALVHGSHTSLIHLDLSKNVYSHK